MRLQATAPFVLGVSLLFWGALAQAAPPTDTASGSEARYASAKQELAAKRYSQALKGFRALIASSGLTSWRT